MVDVEQKETALKFLGGMWSIAGDAADVRRSDERGNIMVTLEGASDWMSPTDIADVAGMKNGNIRKLLLHMGKGGEVWKHGRGNYAHPKNVDAEGNFRTPGNKRNKVTIGGSDEE